MPPDAARFDVIAASIERLQRVGSRVWEPLAEELDLTEVTALALVSVGEGAGTVSAVADACGRHVSSASRIVDGLVQRGLVGRQPDDQDRRAVRLTLTPAGRTAADRIVSHQRGFLAACLEDLPPAEVDDLARSLARLAAVAEDRAAG